MNRKKVLQTQKYTNSHKIHFHSNLVFALQLAGSSLAAAESFPFWLYSPFPLTESYGHIDYLKISGQLSGFQVFLEKLSSLKKKKKKANNRNKKRAIYKTFFIHHF